MLLAIKDKNKGSAIDGYMKYMIFELKSCFHSFIHSFIHSIIHLFIHSVHYLKNLTLVVFVKIQIKFASSAVLQE